jgi:hypothetical protein
MVCSQISSLLGVACHPLNEDGSVAMLDTPFVFEDGDSVPVFLERAGPQIRFFDDGATVLHFYGRGISIENLKKVRFIKNAAEAHGVTLNEHGVLEIWANESEAPLAFSKYIAALVSLINWETEQIGVSTDTSLFVAEVAQCLHAWKPNAKIAESPEYVGVSGQTYKLDFDFNDEAVIAITPHHSAVSAAIKKLLDIRSRPENAGLKILAVIDDRYDSKAAKREGLIMDALANVWPMSRLERQAGLTGLPN